MNLRFASALLLLSLSVAASASRLDDALQLQRAGKLKAADQELRALIPDLRASGQRADLARALSAESWISVSLGNYTDAIQQASEAIELRRALHDRQHLGDDMNTRALAHQNLGDYPAALAGFEQALQADRAAGDAEGAITRLDNIGSVYYFQGRYLDALRSYQRAQADLEAAPAAAWSPRRRQVTTANLAAVYQRLGKEDTALELYQRLAASPQAMPARERAQLLLNQGALYRRLGDPVKALELYRAAQNQYAIEHYSDGEIGALRNTGIARAVDLGDLRGALEAFTAALLLAQNSSNQRGIVQAALYRGEVLRRLDRWEDARADAATALQSAKAAGLIEEEWKALYLLGRIAEQTADTGEARRDYQNAIALIESVRSRLQLVSLRTEFLADKRDVYDALIALRLRDAAPAEELFRWVEQSRARTLGERAAVPAGQDLKAAQQHLAPDTVLLDFWMGPQSGAVVWITASQSGIAQLGAGAPEASLKFREALTTGAGNWRELGAGLGRLLLSGVPQARHMLVVPDGPLSGIPFEALAAPASGTLLVEAADVSYLPSAQFLLRAGREHRWRFPWQTEMVALGDPPAASLDALAERWPALPASAQEIRAIARILAGRSETHLGPDARKDVLRGTRLRNVPFVHLSTHAMLDPDNPDRSRILLASDYIFQGEVYNLDLQGVDLVTLSACDTARGKMIRGEGVQAFSRAFLAAGASATVTSLWRVSDQPSAAFMQQFYYFLAHGQTKAEALRSAKLRFLRSPAPLDHPRQWAAFVLTGAGWNAAPLSVSWSALAFGAAILLGGFALLARRALPTAARITPRTAAASIASRPR